MAAQGASAFAPPSLGRPVARRHQRSIRPLHTLSAVNRGGLILPGSDGFPGGDFSSGSSERDSGGERERVPAGFGPQAARAPNDGPLYQPFRPPASYSDTAKQGKEDLMRRLSARVGRWFDLAKILDSLHASGVQSTEIFETTGISQLDQNSWKVQAVVYYSLEALPADVFPRELLSFFAGEDGAATLAELKIVSAGWRPAAARFVAERRLDVSGAREVARAIVDVERRREPGFSFEHTPGDALAAKIWRDAGEVPRRGGWRDAVATIVARGLSVATGERAKAKLRERLEMTGEDTAVGAAAGATPAKQAQVQIVRLETEESAFRPVPLVGTLEDVTPAQLASAPRCATEGVFNSFRPAGGSTWVALPAWAKLADLAQIVALTVLDSRTLTSVPSLAASPGPCLLLIDRSAGSAEAAASTVQLTSYYLISRASSLLLDAKGGKALERLEIVPGSEARGDGGGRGSKLSVLGRLVLACRPPMPSGTTGADFRNPAGIKDLGDAADAEDYLLEPEAE